MSAASVLQFALGTGVSIRDEELLIRIISRKAPDTTLPTRPVERTLRPSVVRYQLARLLLQHLGKPVTEESIPRILEAIRSQIDAKLQSEGNTLIDEVAHSVVCPDIAYSGRSATISSASPDE